MDYSTLENYLIKQFRLYDDNKEKLEHVEDLQYYLEELANEISLEIQLEKDEEDEEDEENIENEE